MHDLFELVFEYRNLLARRKAEGAALEQPARTRLDALHRLLGREPFTGSPSGSGTFSRRRHARCDVELTATLRVGATLSAVELLNLSAGGVCVVSPALLPVGERGVLRITSPDSGRVHECTALVSWARDEDVAQHLAGLRFVGAPSEVRLVS
jgi:hypothetical protein